MNSSFISKYKPAIILTLALTIFLASSKLPGKSWVVSTLAGSGIPAQFDEPYGVAVDSSGNVYVADTANHIIWRIESGGETQYLRAQFIGPHAVAVDSSGNIYVADTGNNCIRKITSAGKVTTFAGSGTAGHIDATGTAAQFDFPTGVAVDSSGNIYVADLFNHRIRKITSEGVVTTIAGGFNRPHGVAVDSSGSIVYVGDTGGHRIRKIEYK